ncbi:intraflagellar transport protein 20 homolog isoform X3 [Scophthalmus maximus]|uniref:intraflagellar transport protein 20 homolog isoform X3 n=1 Tax=Scophthalmus maximus TaxID=52904 RepID=UPI001FA8B6E0|nr:intraflagellar transport protein 20 homolog isoform X3 [Scophthalmus maximus]
MAKDPLAEAGFYFDDLNKLRVLEPDVSQKTSELKEECKDFVDKIGQFGKIARGVIELVDELAKEVDTEKMEVSSTMDELLFNSPQMPFRIRIRIRISFIARR